MKRRFLNLFKYDIWATSLLKKVVDENELNDEYINKMLSHIITAQIIWLHRIEGLPTSPFPVWEVYNGHEIDSMMNESHSKWVHFLEGYKLDSLDEVIQYQNTSGRSFESRLEDIIQHVLNHSTHHRGQVSSRLRQIGITPPATDYIFYLRNN